MLQKVVVGTDFSKPSEAVLDYLPRLKSAGVERVILTHVVQPLSTASFGENARERTRTKLEEQAERLRQSGLAVETEIARGSTSVELTKLAEEREAGAIVVGSHGRSLLGRILLGSVSMSLLDQASVPVLIVRVELCKTDAGISCELQSEMPFEHILFPTDFSQPARLAFEQVVALAARTGAGVTLFHVSNPPAYADDEDEFALQQLHAEDRERLERMADELEAAGVGDVRTVVTTGSPAVAATKYAAAEDVTLIAMSTEGREAMEELMVGSVALKIARTSPVPVLLMPRPRGGRAT
jgi:nucleotide-binding universal stress UspA family protein